MSLIQVRKKGAQPAEGFIAKYHAPQTGTALLEALALRVGAGDLEDAHGVSVTKADGSVAPGDYLFTPGVPPIFRIEDLRPVGHLALDTPNPHSNGGLQSLADLVPTKIAKTSTGGFHHSNNTAAAHQSNHQPVSGGLPGPSTAANTSSGIAAMGLPLSWSAYSSPNLQLAGMGRGDPRLQGDDADALGLSSDPHGQLMGSDMSSQMGVLRKGKGYGGAGGQKRCKWCTERAGYDVSKSKHLCVQFMESMGRVDLAQEARLEKRAGWDHDADGNKIKLEPSPQSIQMGSTTQQQPQQQLHSGQDMQSHLQTIGMSHAMDHSGSMQQQPITSIHMSHHHPQQPQQHHHHHQQQPQQQSHAAYPTISSPNPPHPTHHDRGIHGTPTSGHHHSHHSSHPRHHDIHTSVISSPIT